MPTNRRSLWWLCGPPVVFLVVPPFVNRVEPVVLGLPFLVFWLFVATLLTPLFVWLAAKGDPVWAAARQAERRVGRPGPTEPDERGDG
jgi:hypothetical protein